MGRRGCPPEFRCKVLDLAASGRKVSEVAFDLEISDQTVCSWLRQDRIDRGLEPGLTAPERAEPRAAKRRIAELEAVLAIHRRAPEAVLARFRADPKPSSAAVVAEAGRTTASSIHSLRVHTGQARRRARLVCASAGQEGQPAVRSRPLPGRA